MKPVVIALLALTALGTGGGALYIALRTGWAGPGFPLVFLGLLIALTCLLRLYTLLR
jgi:hypothetical protein